MHLSYSYYYYKSIKHFYHFLISPCSQSPLLNSLPDSHWCVFSICDLLFLSSEWRKCGGCGSDSLHHTFNVGPCYCGSFPLFSTSLCVRVIYYQSLCACDFIAAVKLLPRSWIFIVLSVLGNQDYPHQNCFLVSWYVVDFVLCQSVSGHQDCCIICVISDTIRKWMK